MYAMAPMVRADRTDVTRSARLRNAVVAACSLSAIVIRRSAAPGSVSSYRASSSAGGIGPEYRTISPGSRLEVLFGFAFSASGITLSWSLYKLGGDDEPILFQRRFQVFPNHRPRMLYIRLASTPKVPARRKSGYTHCTSDAIQQSVCPQTTSFVHVKRSFTLAHDSLDLPLRFSCSIIAHHKSLPTASQSALMSSAIGRDKISFVNRRLREPAKSIRLPRPRMIESAIERLS